MPYAPPTTTAAAIVVVVVVVVVVVAAAAAAQKDSYIPIEVQAAHHLLRTCMVSWSVSSMYALPSLIIFLANFKIRIINYQLLGVPMYKRGKVQNILDLTSSHTLKWSLLCDTCEISNRNR